MPSVRIFESRIRGHGASAVRRTGHAITHLQHRADVADETDLS